MLVIRISSPSSLVSLSFWRSFRTISSMVVRVMATAQREDLLMAKEKTLVEGGKSRVKPRGKNSY